MKSLKLSLLFVCAVALTVFTVNRSVISQSFIEAPVGFDSKTNGLTDQATFDANLATFAERDEIADGLGPVYNAQSCSECHQSPVVGGGSQVNVLRAGHRDAQGDFVEAPGGSLIHDRAINASLQEVVSNRDTVRTFRASLSVLGDGFVEAIDDNTLIELARNQARLTNGEVTGQVIHVPLLEAPGVTRVGRFGWKNQHASLLSFSADAYLNEVGITSRLLPHENTSMGRSVAEFDTVNDPEDVDNDIDVFAQFMRATKAPARDAILSVSRETQMGELLFNQVGCAVCHVSTFVTAPVGTVLNGGTFTVSRALGSKVIHPYGDFLLHNVGTGDGIVQNGDQNTANKLRTAPLWGLRTRNRFMHDGQSLTHEDAIRRHRGEATSSVNRYSSLNPRQQSQLASFLRSL